MKLLVAILFLHASAAPVNNGLVDEKGNLTPWAANDAPASLPLPIQPAGWVEEEDQPYVEPEDSDSELDSAPPQLTQREPEIQPVQDPVAVEDGQTPLEPIPETQEPEAEPPVPAEPAPAPAPTPAKPKLSFLDRINLWAKSTKNAFKVQTKQVAVLKYLFASNRHATEAQALAKRIEGIAVRPSLEPAKQSLVGGARLMAFYWEEFGESLMRLKYASLEHLFLTEPHKEHFKRVYKQFEQNNKGMTKAINQGIDNLKERRNEDLAEDIETFGALGMDWSETLQEYRDVLSEIHEDVPTRRLNNEKFFKKLLKQSDQSVKDFVHRRLLIDSSVKSQEYKTKLLVFADYAVETAEDFKESLDKMEELKLVYNKLEIKPAMEKAYQDWKSITERFDDALEAANDLVLGQTPIHSKQKEAIEKLEELVKEWDTVVKTWGSVIQDYVESNDEHKDDEITRPKF